MAMPMRLLLITRVKTWISPNRMSTVPSPHINPTPMGSRESSSARVERNTPQISSMTPTMEPSPMVEMSC
ncbi:hypothetical protein D3C86_1351980 [compost metagenome]